LVRCAGSRSLTPFPHRRQHLVELRHKAFLVIRASLAGREEVLHDCADASGQGFEQVAQEEHGELWDSIGTLQRKVNMVIEMIVMKNLAV
jgi:hypothetical protein